MQPSLGGPRAPSRAPLRVLLSNCVGCSSQRRPPLFCRAAWGVARAENSGRSTMKRGAPSLMPEIGEERPWTEDRQRVQAFLTRQSRVQSRRANNSNSVVSPLVPRNSPISIQDAGPRLPDIDRLSMQDTRHPLLPRSLDDTFSEPAPEQQLRRHVRERNRSPEKARSPASVPSSPVPDQPVVFRRTRSLTGMSSLLETHDGEIMRPVPAARRSGAPMELS